jgi:hypothetical protein
MLSPGPSTGSTPPKRWSTEEVASCLIEPERCRIRFTAPAVRAEPLVERFYLEGGLTWCSGHALGPPPGQAVSPR